MANKITDSITTSTVGAKTPGISKFPEAGATFQVSLSAGAATVELVAWVIDGAKETLATFQLPFTDPTVLEKEGDMFDSVPVYSLWHDFEWNVLSITGGGTLTLAVVGVEV